MPNTIKQINEVYFKDDEMTFRIDFLIHIDAVLNILGHIYKVESIQTKWDESNNIFYRMEAVRIG